jgi:glucose-6-phosphate 1-epimerase
MGVADRIAELNGRFGIAGIANVVEGKGGMPRVSIVSPKGEGEMFLHGGHVTSWKPRGREEVLFVSAASRWEDGRAIRGGIPICFPWFGDKADDPKAPAHGLVRAKAWQLESIVQDGDSVTVTMFTANDESTKKWWPAEFRLVHRARFGAELSLELEMTNTGAASLRFEEALHTYLRVGDIARARVRGLDTVHYLDKTDGNREKTQHGEIVIAAETDSVYLDTGHAIELEDPVLHRRIQVSKENSLASVVWNPWIEKAKAMSDLGNDEWKQMVCIESCNVSKHAVTLAPGERHSMNAVIGVSDSSGRE